MNDTEEYVLGCIKKWVWSGFHSPDEVEMMMEDILEPGCDEEMLRAAILPEFRLKRDTEAGWPEVTDCDKLDRVFRELDELGICALQNAGYTQSDGHSDVTEK